MSLMSMMGISGSAMTAERQRAEVIATNLANTETTRTPGGTPFQRKQVVFASDSQADAQGMSFLSALDRAGEGVKIADVVEDQSAVIRRYQPWHPDADKEGYVSYPDIDPAEEMADLMSSTRAYQLNATAVQAAKTMIAQALEIGS